MGMSSAVFCVHIAQLHKWSGWGIQKKERREEKREHEWATPAISYKYDWVSDSRSPSPPSPPPPTVTRPGDSLPCVRIPSIPEIDQLDQPTNANHCK